jgi:arabinose-5-phosphate isomerase
MTKKHDFCAWAIDVIECEAAAITELQKKITPAFAQACEILFHCQGHIVVMGIGKSGHIGNKIAATLASTGSPAFFVHAAEACHGDFGMITPRDVVIAISNSGKTNEILTLLPFIKSMEIPLISLTGDINSPLAKEATVCIDIGVPYEAGPLDLAPTASTTATLVIGDALAIALLRARDFTAEDFARTHPGGTLGKRLLLRVDELMLTGSAIPMVSPNTLLKSALFEMTAKRLGMTTVVDEVGHLLGVFTDGDLRRAIESDTNFFTTSISELMTHPCKTTTSDVLAYEIFNKMENFKITALPVVDADNIVIGLIHLHAILESGVI